MLWEKWQEVLSEQRSFEFEYEITTASGERKWVLEWGRASSTTVVRWML